MITLYTHEYILYDTSSIAHYICCCYSTWRLWCEQPAMRFLMTIKHHTINLAVIYMVTFLAVPILFSPLEPYMCAQDLNTCIYDPALISVAELVSLTNVAAQNHEIDSSRILNND